MPTKLELRIPAYLDIRTPKPFMHTTPTAPQAVYPKTFGFVFYTWDQLDPTDHSIAAVSAAPHIRGYKYVEVWRPFFLSRGLSIGTATSANGFADPGTDEVWEYCLSNNAGHAQVDENVGNSTKYVQLRGEGVFHLASAFDYFCSGHGYGTGHRQRIKSLSSVNTKCGIGLLNFESAAQPIAWNPALDALQLSQRAFALDAGTSRFCTAPNLNSYGCSAIDKYEPYQVASGSGCSAVYEANAVACPHTPAHNSLPARAALGGVHTWECDVRRADYIGSLIGALSTFDIVPGGGGKNDVGLLSARSLGYDFQLWDNMLEDPYDGGPTTKNTFPADYTSAAYRGTRSVDPAARSGWKGFQQALQERYGTEDSDFLWANTYGISVSAYDALDIRNRFAEGYFLVPGSGALDTLANIKSRALVAKTNGLRIAIHAQTGSASPWGTWNGPGGAYGTWPELLAYLESIEAIEDTVVVNGRNSFYLYWQEGFRPLV